MTRRKNIVILSKKWTGNAAIGLVILITSGCIFTSLPSTVPNNQNHMTSPLREPHAGSLGLNSKIPLSRLLRTLTNPQANFSLQLKSATSPLVIGQLLKLYITSQIDGFVNLYHINSSGKTARLLHNKKVIADKTISFPGPMGKINFQFDPPTGEEIYILIMTKTSQQWLTQADLKGHGALTALALTARQLVDRLAVTTRQIDAKTWNSAVLRLPLIDKKQSTGI